MTKNDKILGSILTSIFLVIIGVIIGVGFCVMKYSQNNQKNNEEIIVDKDDIYNSIKSNADEIIKLFAFYKKEEKFTFDFHKDFELDMLLEFIANRYSKSTEDYKEDVIKELNSKGYAINSEEYYKYINILTIIPEEDIKKELNVLFGTDELYNEFIKENEYISSAKGFVLVNNIPAETGMFEVFTMKKYELDNEIFKIYYQGKVEPIGESERTLILSFKEIDGKYYFDSLSTE